MKKQRLIANLLILGFILGVHEGKVALWMDGKKTPIRVFPYSASSLPEEDQRKLEQGVHFDSIRELKRFVEDYMS